MKVKSMNKVEKEVQVAKKYATRNNETEDRKYHNNRSNERSDRYDDS